MKCMQFIVTYLMYFRCKKKSVDVIVWHIVFLICVFCFMHESWPFFSATPLPPTPPNTELRPVSRYVSQRVNQPASASVWLWKAVLGKSLEDACSPSAQEALEELGCWSDNDFLVFGRKFLGRLNITPGWTQLSADLSPSLSLSVFLS